MTLGSMSSLLLVEGSYFKERLAIGWLSTESHRLISSFAWLTAPVELVCCRDSTYLDALVSAGKPEDFSVNHYAWCSTTLCEQMRDVIYKTLWVISQAVL